MENLLTIKNIFWANFKAMSYTSTSILKASTTISQVQDVIDLLGYKRVRDGVKIPNRISGYFWAEEVDYQSWAGVELDIYKTLKGPVKVTTRSRVARSYWDLSHQNRTLKVLRDLFGGYFETDAGRNRYCRPDEPPPSPLSSGCYLARWQFHNNLQRASIYLMHRQLEGDMARDGPSGLLFMDEINPRLLSNNMIVPYMIAVWEEYFRATFTACLRYSKKRDSVLKQANNLSHFDLDRLITGVVRADRLIAETFSFQRPGIIAKNFRLIDSKIDIAGLLRKPYRGRRQSLFDSIDGVVEDRNRLVHSGEINSDLFDRQLKVRFGDITEAVNRVYNHIAKINGFVANHNY
ncbi:hypothetical protein [Polynucleobacter sp. AP-Nickl1-40-C4]|uniref:hypothetical protein n=1 Tax=Polynucleobacter sp. AP-Nickl1-40-C4 TaxID=3108275 RepID=UPI002B231E7F|nr:hypothetical protein [Polynucleobacter sp. AP-Nickl1-40-C4]MEA9567370.1 hypothetical protein [Polynucleobacter sp. AP-Nickl1-40-C4]